MNVGQEGIREFFIKDQLPEGLLHLLMTLSGIVDVDPNGKTAILKQDPALFSSPIQAKKSYHTIIKIQLPGSKNYLPLLQIIKSAHIRNSGVKDVVLDLKVSSTKRPGRMTHILKKLRDNDSG